jgi:serine/threonine protein kinase
MLPLLPCGCDLRLDDINGFSAAPAILGEYRIRRRLGSGGGGCAYLAGGRHGREVVVKTPRAWSNVPELFQEARCLAGPPLPHIARPLALALCRLPGVGPAVPVLVLEAYAGSLADRLADAGRIAPPLAARWIDQLATALAASGLLHRDLKPENVLLDAADQAWLCDFGLALPASPLVRQRIACVSIGHIGTPIYMAPEQIYQAADIDERADIYALGLLLFELLTGELAHPLHREGQSELDYLESLLLAEVPWQRVADPGLAAVVRRCTAKRRRERYADHGALRVALAAARTTAPHGIPAAPLSLPARARAWPPGGR